MKNYKTTKVAAAVLSSAMVATAILPSSVVFAEEEKVDTVTTTETAKSRLVRVEYVNAAGQIVDARRVDVAYGRMSLTVMAPAGYDLFDTNNIVAIDDTTKTVKVQVVKKAAPTSRLVRVEYVNAAGQIIDARRVDVAYGKLSLTVMAPEGYDLFDTNNVIAIDDTTKTVKVQVVKKAEPEAPKSRLVRVEYVNAAGQIIEAKRVDVAYGKLSLTVKAPEGYDLFDTNNVISIDDTTKTVKVQVVKKAKPEAPKSRLVRVNYKDAAGRTVSTSRVDVEYGRLTMTVKAPEGYDLVDTNNVISIDDDTKEINVSVMKHIVDIEGTQTVVVKLFCGSEKVGKDLQVEVPAAAKFVEKADLEKLFTLEGALPEGYQLKALSDAYYIDGGEIRLAVVKEFTDLVPGTEVTPATPLQPAKPVEPAKPVKPAEKPAKTPTGLATNVFGAVSAMTASLAAAFGLIASKKRK